MIAFAINFNASQCHVTPEVLSFIGHQWPSESTSSNSLEITLKNLSNSDEIRVIVINKTPISGEFSTGRLTILLDSRELIVNITCS